MRKLFIVLIITLASFVAFAAPTVAWDPNRPAEMVTHYNIHWGNS